MKSIKTIVTALFLSVTAISFAQKDIVSTAVGAENLSTLVTAVKAADLVETLQGEGPFTVFAPDNAAFAKVDQKTLNMLLEPKNKKMLQSVLTYHVVSGKFKAEEVIAMIKDKGNNLRLKTVEGGFLTAMIQDGNVVLKDVNGNMSTITATDVEASNGVVHVINSVVMPAM
jgi:uncharacterized surface protein with fasciclin (FAS1) repeats